ncbi:MAG: hypothetical protein KAR38_11720, partial [Calditrichia bacterium]|nr:hypothetical protein [Calditrichia bacterium]
MRILLITGLSLFLLLQSGCETEKQQSEITYPLETAKLISGSTSGMIGSSSEIQVLFSENIIPADLINQPVTKAVFSFSPAIDGHTFWKDERTLTFKPNQKLPLLQEYQAELYLKLLLSQRDENLKPFPFRFQVGGREVESFSADFYPVKADDPKFLIYKGELTFTETVKTHLLNKAATVQIDQKKISLKWQGDASRRKFSFTSKPLARSKQSKPLTFNLDQKILEISSSFSQSLKLPSLSALSISDVQIVADQAQPQLQLHFSDDLLPSQDLNGFIQIEPHMPLKLKRTGKKVLVQANFEHGQTYSIIVKPGIRSKWATKTEQDFKEKITFEDLLPKIRFANNGVFLPSSNKQKIAFQTVNVRRVDLKITKVFESNLGHFLHLENLSGNKDRNRNFNYNIKQVGIEVIQKELQIGTERNRWL